MIWISIAPIIQQITLQWLKNYINQVGEAVKKHPDIFLHYYLTVFKNKTQFFFLVLTLYVFWDSFSFFMELEVHLRKK